MTLYKSYKKYLFKRDTIFATVFVFLLIGLLSLIPLNTGILNPIKTALADFDFNDIAYAKLGKNSDTRLDERIVIVNIGTADRGEIAAMIAELNKAEPKVIGLDVVFKGPREPYTDQVLMRTIQQTPKIVGASRLNWASENKIEEKGYYANVIPQFGYANFIGEDAGTIRYFSPMERTKNQQYRCFAAALIEKGDPEKFADVSKRKRELEKIHYKRKADQYLVVDGLDVLGQKFDPQFFKDKYIIMGYINPSENDIEDKHFTPMNASVAGKARPDMNGSVIHANILSMMLDNSYIRKLPWWINWFLIISIAWLHIALFIRYYVESHIWFHLAAKVAQIISAIFFVFISIMLFHWFGLEINIKVPFIVIIVAIDVIYFYEAFALWLNKKFGYHTIFNHTKH